MDICDRILCPIKAAIITFCNEGHYILTTNDMHTAALNEWLVKGTTTTVCSVDESNKNAEGKKLEALTNFTTTLLFVSGAVMALVMGSLLLTSLKLCNYKNQHRSLPRSHFSP